MTNKRSSGFYDTLVFIEDLRINVEKLVIKSDLWRGKLSENRLSEFLTGRTLYIKDVLKRQLKRNPEFILSLEVLSNFKENLSCKFGTKSQESLDLIDKYIEINKPLKSTKFQIYKNHPNFNIDYFKDINTLEKAYWLGFFYADGYLERMNGKKIRIGIELSIKDEILIDRFAKALGLNLKFKKKRIRKLSYKGRIKEFEHVYIRFINSKMVQYLKKWGVKEIKSKKIELPKFNNYKIELAFLLGFYDGDGVMGTTKVVSGSKIFLNQIKEKYRLPYKIGKHKYGEKWILSLGSALFNEMMDNYNLSLERKRKKFVERRYAIKKGLEDNITKEVLQNLVWELSIIKIAEKYGVWHHTITDLCNKWNIKKPPQGYWSRKK